MRLTGVLISGGTLLQVGSCVGSAIQFVGQVNPCGTILNCDPRVYDFARSGIDGPGVNPNQDPFCTFAPYCDESQDPIFGGITDIP
jgi:hypothetical protein